MSDNSFFHEDYSGKRVLVIVPHPDDEINVAGNLIYTLIRQGAEIFVVFSTNGDFQSAIKTRVKEAFRSLKLLGVSRENVIFMGYGDSYNTYAGMHISESAEEPVQSKSGHKETYGVKDIDDYAYKKRGAHSKYCRNDFCKDLREIIEDILADLIICVDFDQHPDHRWLTLAFDEVMCQLLKREGNDYYPQILKRFAYATAFCAIDDIEELNLQETKRPNINDTLNYKKDIIDYGNWIWLERVRIPINPKIRKNYFIAYNPLVKAMCAHKSQYMALRAGRIINSDEVYFERRSDSTSYSAKVNVSSGDGKYINDFKYIGTKDIKNKVPTFEDYLWIPEEGDNERKISLEWNTTINVSLIKLYFGISTKQVRRVRICLNDGFDKDYTGIPKGMMTIRLGKHENINKLDIILEELDIGAGISEVEVFAEEEYKRVIRPFIKILLNDNFVYDERKWKNQEYVIDSYQYGCDKNVSYELTGQNARIEQNKLLVGCKVSRLNIKAQGLDGIFDEVTINNNNLMNSLISIFQKIDKFWIKKYKCSESLHRWKLSFRDDGFVHTINRLLKKF